MMIDPEGLTEEYYICLEYVRVLKYEIKALIYEKKKLMSK
jgi:hypothetical protein